MGKGRHKGKWSINVIARCDKQDNNLHFIFTHADKLVDSTLNKHLIASPHQGNVCEMHKPRFLTGTDTTDWGFNAPICPKPSDKTHTCTHTLTHTHTHTHSHTHSDAI